MAESYTDEELRTTSPGSIYAEPLRLMATVIRLQNERDAAKRNQDKAEDAAGRLGEDLLLAREQRNEAERVAKVLAWVDIGDAEMSDEECAAMDTALAYPDRKL